MEQSKAGYYADFILYPLLIVSLGVFDLGSAHKVPYLWLSSLAFGLLTWTIVEYGSIASFCILLKRSLDFTNNTMRRLVRMWELRLGSACCASRWVGSLPRSFCSVGTQQVE